jgi:hypothetical protein
MKKHFIFVLSILACAFTSCINWGNGGDEPTFQLSALQGLWQEDDTQHYVRFTTEQSDEAGYLYGREWDEAEDVREEDLLTHGNGWFKYLFETNGQLTEIHLMDNGGADIPKVYVVSVLTNTRLEYYEKDFPAFKYYFNKIVSTE